MRRNVPTGIEKKKRKRRRNRHAEVAQRRKNARSEFRRCKSKLCPLFFIKCKFCNFFFSLLPTIDQKSANEVDHAARKKSAAAHAARTKYGASLKKSETVRSKKFKRSIFHLNLQFAQQFSFYHFPRSKDRDRHRHDRDKKK